MNCYIYVHCIICVLEGKKKKHEDWFKFVYCQLYPLFLRSCRWLGRGGVVFSPRGAVPFLHEMQKCHDIRFYDTCMVVGWVWLWASAVGGCERREEKYL